MSQSDLEQKVGTYAELARENKNIDVTALMINALQTEQQNLLSPRTKRWAYLISLGIPPLGLLFAAWFFFSGRDDGRRSALICVSLTVVTVLLLWFTAKLFFSSTGIDMKQVQQIKVQDIQELTQ